MFQRIKDKILEYVEYPEDKITEATEIVRDLQMSSLDIMMLLGDLENEYNIVFDPEEIKDIVNIGDFVNLLKNKIK